MGKRNPEHVAAYNAAYNAAHQEERRQQRKAWKERNAEYARAYDRQHHQERRDEDNAYSVAYRKTEAGKAARRAMYEKSKAAGQRVASEAVRRAVAAGRLTKQPCHCGAEKVQAHHHLGYAPEHRLDVLWLCATHHAEAHRVARA